MKVLLLGSGGREHALARSLSKSSELYCLPGNPGIEKIAHCLSGNSGNLNDIEKAVDSIRPEIVVPGPELPLTMGVKDVLDKKTFVYGPNKKGAQLEGSKAFAKEFMQSAGIPTARFEIFDDSERAHSYIKEKGAPIVVKADGLAQGKGSIVCRTEESAHRAVKDIMELRVFGDAGNTSVIEKFLKGVELSILTLVAGDEYLIMPPSQDHKPVFDNDEGPNTGGMGAYAPCPFVHQELKEIIENRIVKPAVKHLHIKGFDYQGVLYVGLMITRDGPYVLEFNVRFGDPEAQPLLYLMNTDLVEIIEKTREFRLGEIKFSWKKEYALLVVIASGGYPGTYEKGKLIRGIEEIESLVYQAGTKREGDKLFTAGGRVLGVLGYGKTLLTAQKNAYDACNKIHFDGMHYRKDIGNKGFKSLKELGVL